MNKVSILDIFAADAINAPAMITGGGKCKAKSKSKKNKCAKVKSKSGGSKSGGSKSQVSCNPKPPVCW